jgi:hypothetical protein
MYQEFSKLIETELNIIAKPVGFKDVNGCLILKKIYRLKIKHEQRRDFITIKKYRKALH